MELKLDLSKEYGIVLEGGGAKGAYQVGAWKALREVGIKIKGIAGASVGSLNGALMCMDDLEAAENIWKNIEYSHVMDVSDTMMNAIKSRDYKAINLQELLSGGLQVIRDGGFDVTPLRNLIADTIDEDKIRNSDRELFVTTYSVSDHRQLAVDVKMEEPGTVKDMLLASAYFMAFKNEKLGGKRYMDGGGLNNIPVGVLLDRGYKDIIIIRIYGLGFDSEKVTRVPEDATIYHIAPRQDLGGILEFDKKLCKKNMTLGYFDAQRFLYGLSGKNYYIYAPNSEPYYFDKMMSELELLKAYIKPELTDQEFETLHGYRAFTEELFPQMAASFKLKEDWNYKDMYIAILEELARRLRISRFKVYSVDELLQKIYRKRHAVMPGSLCKTQEN